jgi:hypothetical protein
MHPGRFAGVFAFLAYLSWIAPFAPSEVEGRSALTCLDFARHER